MSLNIQPKPLHKTPAEAHKLDAEQPSNPPIAVCVEDAFEKEVADYEICSRITVSPRGELHEQPLRLLAEVVAEVVEVEGPVHLDEVVRRIRSLWGLRRSGRRIAGAIKKAVSYADKNGHLSRQGAFLWPKDAGPVRVRRRSDDPPPRIELICDEEIGEAVKLVLKYQFATLPDDLIVKSSRLLGIQATRGKTAIRIKSVIKKLIAEGGLQKMPNGMVNFANS